ncbi:MAG TPA: hypothetical protein VGR92_21000 [Steroidobacteraceae bacterium]|nr:hypothetical protein [Steroidobacteraceae bacterium]
MSAVLLAVFSDFETAERARLALFRDGFPTDRIALTARGQPGGAATEPTLSLHDRLAQYFRTLFAHADGAQHAHRLADRIEHGAATITVLPRGDIEVKRAAELLGYASPEEVLERDLDDQSWEFAAAPRNLPWVRTLWVDSGPDAPHCIYCRLFPGSAHDSH